MQAKVELVVMFFEYLEWGLLFMPMLILTSYGSGTGFFTVFFVPRWSLRRVEPYRSTNGHGSSKIRPVGIRRFIWY